MSVRTGRYILESALLGLTVGLVTSAFEWMIDGGERLRALVTSTWLGVLLPAFGAMSGAWLIGRFAHISQARGTDSAIHAFHRGEDIPRTVIPVKSVASVLTVASGGSAGYEGPVTLLGAACGRLIARALHLDRHAARILLAAGVGAGIAALFRAPLAGAIFGAEIFYSSSDIEYEAFLPSFIASAIAYTVFACFHGWMPLFQMPTQPFTHGMHLVPYAVLAIVITLAARLYIRFFRMTEDAFRRLHLPFIVKVGIGGLVAGALALLFPDVRGAGYGMVVRCLEPAASADLLTTYGKWVPCLFLAFFAIKVLATSFTVGSGGSGGVFAPALVCGAAVGMATGLFFRQILPASIAIEPSAFALTGMAGFLAASVRVPLAAIVMVAEISGNHELLLPAMWVCGIAFWLNNGWSLYRSQVHDRESSPLHMGAF